MLKQKKRFSPGLSRWCRVLAHGKSPKALKMGHFGTKYAVVCVSEKKEGGGVLIGCLQIACGTYPPCGLPDTHRAHCSQTTCVMCRRMVNTCGHTIAQLLWRQLAGKSHVQIPDHHSPI